METIQAQKITFYTPQPKAVGIKIAIPYLMKIEREAFKKHDYSFYHPGQKLWSLYNTPENIEKIKSLFGNNLQEVWTTAPKKVPKAPIN